MLKLVEIVHAGMIRLHEINQFFLLSLHINLSLDIFTMLPAPNQPNNGSGTDKPQLQPEIWISIIEQLRQPRPLAGTKFYRSAIRQHDLSIMMRVSRVSTAQSGVNILSPAY